MPLTAIPVTSSLDQVYTPSSLLSQGARWDALFSKFQESYGAPVESVARAPGRVNVIGECVSIFSSSGGLDL